MKKTLLAAVLALAMSYGFINTACAQSVSSIERAVNAAIMLENQMAPTRKNLAQRARGLPLNEREAVHIVLTADNELFGAYSEVVSVGQILTAMKSAEDQSIVRQFFKTSSRGVVSAADVEVEYINLKSTEFSAGFTPPCSGVMVFDPAIN
jgi:hypothetical protein